MTDYKAKLSAYVLKAINEYSSDMAISPANISMAVYEDIDPKHISPTIVEWGCIMQIRVVARFYLKEKYEDKNESGQGELTIGGIQERYPMEDHSGYVHIEYLPKSDLEYNVKRLRRNRDSLDAHADALEAKGREFEESGHYDRMEAL